MTFQTGPSPGTVQISSPETNGMVIPMGTNTTYLIHICFTSFLDTNDPGMFQLSINGVLQPQSSVIFSPSRHPAAPVVPGCAPPLYNWSGASPGANIIQVLYSNNAVVLNDTRNVIVLPPFAISGLTNDGNSVVWSSVPGVSYIVLATTNLNQPFVPVGSVISANDWSTSFMDAGNARRSRRTKIHTKSKWCRR